MAPVVHIPDDLYSRLKRIAEPFTDTPATVIARLLDLYDSHASGDSSPTSHEPALVPAGAQPPGGATSGAAPVPGHASGEASDAATIEPYAHSGDEVAVFARAIGASDLKSSVAAPRLRAVLRRHNYFLLPPSTYLIVKVSRLERVFYGLGEQFVELFDGLTEHRGTYYFVGLDSDHSGWVLSKAVIRQGIADGSISCSRQAKSEYKINDYNLCDRDRFVTIADFVSKVVHPA
jgi:hypothetical protein